MRRRTFLRCTAGALALGAYPAVPVPAAITATQARGGSNYGWYLLELCTREPFGVVNGFGQASLLISGQLRDMYDAGQRRLRIPVYHRRGPDTGTVMDSTGGNLSAANRRNLADLLAAIRATGFQEVQVAFVPTGENAPSSWTAWHEDLYRENRDLVRNLRPIVARAGIAYRVDLCNEAIPAPNQPRLLEYTRRLWSDYTAAFGRADTIGFSIIADTGRIAAVPKVYGDRPPLAFDFHLYPGEGGDEYTRFVRAHRQMTSMGYRQAWTIGEAHYDDAVAAGNIRRAITETGQPVRYLLQWPIHRGAPSCPDVDVAPPVSFGNWIGRGF